MGRGPGRRGCECMNGRKEAAPMLQHQDGQTEPGQVSRQDRVSMLQSTTTRAHGQIELARG